MSRKTRTKKIQVETPKEDPWLKWVDFIPGCSFCMSRPVTIELLEQICGIRVPQDSAYRRIRNIDGQMNHDPNYKHLMLQIGYAIAYCRERGRTSEGFPHFVRSVGKEGYYSTGLLTRRDEKLDLQIWVADDYRSTGRPIVWGFQEIDGKDRSFFYSSYDKC